MMRYDRPERGIGLSFGERALLLLLVAATAMPLWPLPIGEPITAPFGLTNRAVAVGVTLAALGWSAWRLRVDGPRAAPLVVATLAAAAALSLLFAAIVRWRANGFFTPVALRDGMTALLALHLVGMVLRSSARRRSRRRARRPGAAPAGSSRATRLADDLTTAIAALVASFWLLAALNLHVAAGPVLLLGIATSLFVAVLRVPDALPEPPRRRLTRHGGNGDVRAA
ncbi:MAG TPA: hypothetical protein VFZ11_11620 [Gemmatimonadaceae bacterium]